MAPRTRRIEKPTEPVDNENPAQLDLPASPTPDQLKDTKFVKHLPHEHFGARVIREVQWASIGIRMPTVEWNSSNSWQLPISMFSEEALRYLINVDDGFKIVET